MAGRGSPMKWWVVVLVLVVVLGIAFAILQVRVSRYGHP